MYLAELTSPTVAALPRTTPVVVPIAACEQHGPHLPLFTDSLLLGEVVRRTELRLREQLLVTPLLWLGNSEHHLDFAGTLSAAPRTYLDTLQEIAANLLFHRFHTLVLLNGHGGNIVPGQQALFELRQRHRERDDLRLYAATYWALGTSPRDDDASFVQSQMGHACEWETSMMLHLRPELVGEYVGLPPVSQDRPAGAAYQAWTTRDRSQWGYLGDPARASAAKGARLLDRFTDDVTGWLEGLLARHGSRAS
jgi:creatinine amidohydrolase